MKITKRKIIILIAFLLATIFFMIASRINSTAIAEFDESIANMFVHNDTMTAIMIGITYLGESVTLIPLAVLALIILPNKKEAATVPINLTSIAILNSIAKLIAKRERPLGVRLVEASGYSFPSGHSASSLAFYGFIMYLIYKKCKNKKIKMCSMILLGVLILLIGVSRVYLGVHFASDVCGGFVFAGLYLIIYISICEKFKVLK